MIVACLAVTHPRLAQASHHAQIQSVNNTKAYSRKGPRSAGMGERAAGSAEDPNPCTEL